MSGNLTIVNGARGKIDRAIFDAKKLGAIKEAALGSAYDLSMIITTPAEMKKFNLIYRNKDASTDILSFPISKNEGEMYICPSESKKEAKKFSRAYQNFILFLFIHGCVHLKGYDHSATMEGVEAKLRRKFGV